MKILIGFLIAFVIGAACRYFDIPVPTPPKLIGALIIVAMTLGYVLADSAIGKTTGKMHNQKEITQSKEKQDAKSQSGPGQNITQP